MPDTPLDPNVERLARGISASLTIRLIAGNTNQTYTPNEVAVMVDEIIAEQLARLTPTQWRTVAASEEPHDA